MGSGKDFTLRDLDLEPCVVPRFCGPYLSFVSLSSYHSGLRWFKTFEDEI